MKYFLITITSLLLLTACSYKNAFSNFDMSKKEELLASNTQSSKIVEKESVKGIVTAIYLNNVDIKHIDQYENFLVSVYMKNGEKSYDFILNKSLAVEVIPVPEMALYSDLIKTPRKWDSYYLVKFKASTKKLDFNLESDKFSSSVLHFLKDSL